MKWIQQMWRSRSGQNQYEQHRHVQGGFHGISTWYKKKNSSLRGSLGALLQKIFVVDKKDHTGNVWSSKERIDAIVIFCKCLEITSIVCIGTVVEFNSNWTSHIDISTHYCTVVIAAQCKRNFKSVLHFGRHGFAAGSNFLRRAAPPKRQQRLVSTNIILPHCCEIAHVLVTVAVRRVRETGEGGGGGERREGGRPKGGGWWEI